MSQRWTSYVAPKPAPQKKEGSKPQNGRFPCKMALRLKLEESLLQSEVTTVSRNVLLRTLIRSLV